MESTAARHELGALLEGGVEPPLDRAVALLAVEEESGADPDEMLRGLDRLATGVRLREGATVFESLARLCHHLHVDQGFKGDEEAYDDPANSLLHQVLERRRGLPILLSVLTMEVGRRAGLELDGIGFPGHFLVSPRDVSPRFFVDPFRGGQIIREESLQARLARIAGAPVGPLGWERAVAPVGPRAILVRMTNNLKGAWFRRNDYRATLRQVDRLVLLEPGDPEHYRDRGWLRVRLGKPVEAAQDYDRYLAMRPNADDREEIAGELKAIRG